MLDLTFLSELDYICYNLCEKRKLISYLLYYTKYYSN